MGGRTGLNLLLLLLLWGQRSLGSSCPTGAFLGANGKCFPCTTCEGEQVYVKECSETANAVCKCIGCEECGAGEEQTEEGCQRCPPGTFNSQVNGRCRPWTQCASNNSKTPGTEVKDVICVSAPGSDTTVGTGISTSTILSAVCVGLLLMIFCVFFSLWAKKFPAILKKLSLKPLVQEVEDCTCRYPEEEEGGGSDLSGLKGELLRNTP
ncbi:tumor necrosis factor receptor superfamily member 9 [Paroedura picta]|uniref:tumor necrosis factor receptor superfamily member 9 n=1 Tax=Paroedura picta TaxID=143630 RepID=UPI004056C961